jgi:hypothetical protein
MSSDGGEFHSSQAPKDRAELVKIHIRLESDAPYETESVWAKPIGDGLFVLDNVPFFAYGLSLGDKVYAQRASDSLLEYSGVAEHGGHSTYRVFLADSVASARVETYWKQLRSLGCDREIATARLWSLDLAPSVNIFSVYCVLEEAEAEGVWSFEEAHVGHEIR